MKRVLCPIIVLLLVVTCTPADGWVSYVFNPFARLGEFLVANEAIEYLQEIQRTDFRKTRWGMTPDEVRSIEALEVSQESDSTGKHIIAHQAKVLSLDCHCYYVFVDNKLVRAGYRITEEHSNSNLCLVDYIVLREALTTKYGEGEDVSLWLNDLFKGESGNLGLAVSIGHLTRHTTWSTPQTTILLVAHGDNYEVIVRVEYTSVRLETAEANFNNKQICADL